MKLIPFFIFCCSATWRVVTFDNNGNPREGLADGATNRIGGEIKFEGGSCSILSLMEKGQVWIKENDKWRMLTKAPHDCSKVTGIIAIEQPSGCGQTLPSLKVALKGRSITFKTLRKKAMNYAKKCNKAYRKIDPTSVLHPYTVKDVMAIFIKK